MDDNSSRYLDAFNAIEKWLREQVADSSRYDLPTLIDAVADFHYGVRRHAAKLKDLNRFRNFVVHDFSRTKALAVPTKMAADVISTIRHELLSPASLLSLAAKPVATCRPSESIAVAVVKMRDGLFSQIPVCDEGTCLGLLTTETIARWLSMDLTTNGGLVEEKTIAEVLAHQEDPENHEFLPRDSTAADGLAAFDRFLQRGTRLEAILITENGLPTEGILGIVTVHDVPKMNQQLTI
jgi:predicted transcriptional regulator